MPFKSEKMKALFQSAAKGAAAKKAAPSKKGAKKSARDAGADLQDAKVADSGRGVVLAQADYRPKAKRRGGK